MEDIIEEIMELKRQRKAVILAHVYQPEEIQEIADFSGDSFGLSQKAAATDAEPFFSSADQCCWRGSGHFSCVRAKEGNSRCKGSR